jgi:drug/metabolite transporter (DMT)-like permease
MLEYVLAVLAMMSMGIGGILMKVADRKHCTPLNLTVMLFASAAIMMALNVALFKQAHFVPPKIVIGIAIPFGISAAAAVWVFLHGIRFGKIATSWAIINLSAAVPTIASTLIYKERLGVGKLVALSLIVLAIVLLWKDMKEDQARAQVQDGQDRQSKTSGEETHVVQSHVD